MPRAGTHGEAARDDRPSRILVLSASVGMGHVRAAEAIETAVRRVASEALVENVNVLELTNAGFRRAYCDGFIALVHHAPWLLGYFYDRLDAPTPPKWAGNRLRLAVEQFNLTAAGASSNVPRGMSS